MTDAQILALFLALYPDNNVKYITPDKQRQGLGTMLTELSDRIGELNLLETTDQTNLVNAINEVFLTSIKVPERLQANNGTSIPLPAGKRGDSWYIDIVSSGLPTPNGSIWLGGLSGIIAGQKTWIIAIADTIGGDFSSVGSKYIIVNEKKGTQIVTVTDHASLPPIGEIGVLYITLDTGNTYYWDLVTSDYIQIGTVVEGTLISPTIFEDLTNTPVIPDGTKIYLDTTSGIYYRWDGAQYMPLITLANETKWGDITGDIEDQDDLMGVFNSKLDKPLSDGTFLVNKNGLAVTYVSADSFGQNIANTNLTTTAVRTFTQAFTYTHATDGKIYYVTGLPNKNVDETFRKFRVQDANGQQAVVDKEELYDTKEYKAISSSGIEPTLVELNTFDTDRVDFPNLNRVYLKMTGWKYFEVFDVV